MEGKSFNILCRELNEKIANDINTSNLPIAAVYFIMKNLNKEIENLYYATLNQEYANLSEDFDTPININEDNQKQEEQNG